MKIEACFWFVIERPLLSVGLPTGGGAAISYPLIETATLNVVDPKVWLADALAYIQDYKIIHVDDLLPWKLSNHAA
ncbi:transposase domain-containing protein [Roseovarius ramblicola]|uniref:Transposase domain-containing protein n=1 Tax=Roseovarius ramblicola TaxID=2022336 RepID=A0ABV5HWL1_9RHOB